MNMLYANKLQKSKKLCNELYYPFNCLLDVTSRFIFCDNYYRPLYCSKLNFKYDCSTSCFSIVQKAPITLFTTISTIGRRLTFCFGFCFFKEQFDRLRRNLTVQDIMFHSKIIIRWYLSTPPYNSIEEPNMFDVQVYFRSLF